MLFDNLTQETIYSVIYKNKFIEPQEIFHIYAYYEEVFEINIEQNGNLNNKIKETEHINGWVYLFSSHSLLFLFLIFITFLPQILIIFIFPFFKKIIKYI